MTNRIEGLYRVRFTIPGGVGSGSIQFIHRSRDPPVEEHAKEKARLAAKKHHGLDCSDVEFESVERVRGVSDGQVSLDGSVV